MKSYSVYVQTFPNDKKYVGTTCQPVEKRWRKGKGYSTAQSAIHQAITEVGWDNIRKDIVAVNLDRNAAYQLEKKLISSYHSHITENGYNASTGGASGAQGTVRSEEWKRALSDRISGEKHPLYGKHHSPETRRKIGLSHLGKPNLIARNPKHHEKQMRAVICYETGEVFCSQSEAARKYHVPSPNICVACQLFPHRTSAGYHWMYADDPTAQSVINLPDNPKAPKPVMCLNTSRVYVSIGEAAKATGCDKRHISRCCRGLRKSTKGLRWCYAIQERNDTD